MEPQYFSSDIDFMILYCSSDIFLHKIAIHLHLAIILLFIRFHPPQKQKTKKTAEFVSKSMKASIQLLK